MATLTQQSCDITDIKPDTNTLTCSGGYVTPLRGGHTSIKFKTGENGSTWISTNGITNYYAESQLSTINVRVGGLYAGYSSNVVYRLGTNDFDAAIGNYDPHGIAALAMDSALHKLYIADGNAVYAINNANTVNPVLGKITDLEETYVAKTLSLTDTPNNILVMADNYLHHHLITLNGNKQELQTELNENSGSTSLDNTNIAYYTGESTEFAIYYSQLEGGMSKLEQHQVLPSGFDNLLVAAVSNTRIYMAASILAASGKMSKLYAWLGGEEDGHLEEIAVQNNPFTSGTTICFMRFITDQLYAGGSNGILYRLDELNDKLTWKSVSSFGGDENPVLDSAVDAIGNIYLAKGNGGIWEIPFDQRAAYKLKEYSTGGKHIFATTVAVDNN